MNPLKPLNIIRDDGYLFISNVNLDSSLTDINCEMLLSLPLPYPDMFGSDQIGAVVFLDGDVMPSIFIFTFYFSFHLPVLTEAEDVKVYFGGSVQFIPEPVFDHTKIQGGMLRNYVKFYELPFFFLFKQINLELFCGIAR